MWKKSVTDEAYKVIVNPDGTVTLDNQSSLEQFFMQSLIDFENGTYTAVTEVVSLEGTCQLSFDGIDNQTLNLAKGINHLTVNGLPSGYVYKINPKSKITLKYGDLWKGPIPYPHFEEDEVIKLMRCKNFYRKEWFIGNYSYNYNEEAGAYLFEVALPDMAKKYPTVECKLAYFYDNATGANSIVDCLGQSFREQIDGTNSIIWFKLGNKIKTEQTTVANILLEISCEPL